MRNLQLLWVVGAVVGLTGCLICGEGTHEKDSACVPDEESDTDTDTDADTDADADADADTDTDSDTDLVPVVGSWQYDSFSVTSTSCAGVADDVVSGLSENKGFSISDVANSDFVWLIDGFPESSDCVLSGLNFTCDTLSGNIDNEYVELPTAIDTQGSFSDELSLSGTYEASVECAGTLCDTVETIYEISFPCDFGFSFSASPS